MKYIIRPHPKAVSGFCLICHGQCHNDCDKQCGVH